VHGNYQQLQTKHYHPEEQGAVGRSRANQMLRIVSFDGHIVTLQKSPKGLRGRHVTTARKRPPVGMWPPALRREYLL
jgi:hypothetical protein